MSDTADSPRRRRRPSPPPPPPAGSAIKGAALVVVAVVIGFVLLNDSSSNEGVSAGPGAVTAPDDASDGDGDGGDTGDTTTSSTTTIPVRAESEVKVLVANGTSVAGAAGTTTDELKAAGYVTGTPTNSPNVPATVIYYAATYEPEALRLATRLGVASTAVVPLPVEAPVADLQGSNILVVLGPDVAQAG